jgi:mycothiol synthase
MTGWSITGGSLDPGQIASVLDLAEAAAAADSVAPLSEHVRLHLRYDEGGPSADPAPGRDLILNVNDEIAGYAYLDAPGNADRDVSGEVVVHPRHRGHGFGLALVRRSLRDPLDQPRLPAGTTLRTFRPGRDEQEWLSLNARAFAKHPEQGAWTRHDLQVREQEPWFDPAGFFLAERDGVMTGFHWTKIPAPAEPEQGTGEVYVVGVDPGERGTGLGRALTLAGLGYLSDRGLAEAMLYVDEDNAPAIGMYEGLGFTRWSTDAMYQQRQPAGPGASGAAS